MQPVRSLPFSLISLLALAVAFEGLAWGPINHQLSGCRILGLDGSTCFATVARTSLVLGSSAPDAFKLYLDGDHRLHGFDYANFQLRYALEHPAPTSGEFDALAYSRGFGSHLAQDEVGYQAEGDLPPGVGATWDHLHETVTDMFLAEALSGSYSAQHFSSFGDPAVTFSTAAIQANGRERGDEELAKANQDSVAEAMRRFESLESWEQRVGAFDFFYLREIVFFDPYSASNIDEVRQNLERAISCTVEVAGIWQKNASVRDSTARAESRAVQKAVTNMFRRGLCQPPALQPPGAESSDGCQTKSEPSRPSTSSRRRPPHPLGESARPDVTLPRSRVDPNSARVPTLFS